MKKFKNKKTNYTYIFIPILLLILSGCSSDDDDTSRGNWIVRSVFDGSPRSSATAFSIANKGYMGTGYDGDDYRKDFWEYNMDGDYWTQKADFPGIPRSSASSFSIGTKGYLGLGYDGDTATELADFYEYDPAGNSWVQKNDFAGGIRREAVSFSVGDSGYIGTGFDGDNDKKDFWKYDPTTDQWEEVIGYGGAKRRDATVFVINDKAYIGTGVSNGIYLSDFWQFDPANDTWTRKKDLDEEDDYSIERSNATAFTINGLGYVSCGYNLGATSTTWEYDPSSDNWESITNLEASIRQDPISFSNGTRGLVLLGRSGSLYLDDAFELFPQEDYDEDD